MKLTILASVLLQLLIQSAFAVEGNKDNVIVKYKKYESFDLGNLEIKGQIIAPGDLTVKERARKVFRRDLFDRFNFNPEIKGDIKNLR